MEFEINTSTSAPETACEILNSVKRKFGFLPNLLGVMSSSPELLSAYLKLGELFEQTSLTTEEQDLVLLTISVNNDCGYCVAAHTTIAKMHEIPSEFVNQIRTNQPLADSKLEALRNFTYEIVSSKGWPSEKTKTAFLYAGYNNQQALEVILAVGMKTLSNYTNHLAGTPVDKEFSAGE
tara:strand:+ start:15391 stop:15927 length:537 start_codon:yes stop_codon:yes gene_type:complete